MDKVGVYTREDGGVSVIHPAPKFVASMEGSTPEAIQAAIAKSCGVKEEDILWVGKAQLPVDRKDRDRWVLKSGKVTVDKTR